MPIFIRRWDANPGSDVLLNIESYNILDLDPAAQITAIGTGTVIMVGESEDGPFNTPTAISSSSDLLGTFGGLGYTYNGLVGNYPCAKVRYADSAISPEYWNGNMFVQLSGKRFRALQLVRVDTSVGSVTFSRLASVYGSSNTRFKLTTGQILALDIGGGSVSATFTGTVANVTAAGGSYPTSFVGGETLVIGYDGQPDFTVVFLTADQAIADCIARINSFAGYTMASNSTGQIKLTARQGGTGSKIRIVSGSTGVLTKLGFTAATTSGTGNVVDIDNVTPAEVKTIVELAVTGALVETTPSGRLRASNLATPTTGTIAVGAATTAVNLGFTVGATGTAAAGVATTIPAGTVLNNSGGTNAVVTMKSITVTASTAGPYTSKVRHAVDDGTGVSALGGAITKITTPAEDSAWAVYNPLPLNAALTEAQIDAAYQLAFDSTLSQSSIARTANIIVSARQSNAIRQMGRINAKTASNQGFYGRMFITRAPMNTLKATALTMVTLNRAERLVMCYPNWRTNVPLIASRGTAGGVGFTADGIVDVGADGFLASILSQLAVEEDPGQDTGLLDAVVGLESGANVQNFVMEDYIAFKAAGICAPRIDEGVAIYQSGITSVDPLVLPNRTDINRRRLADYIQDSLSRRGKAFGKKLSTQARRAAMVTEIRKFMADLLSKDQPANQRIAGYDVDAVTGNTADLLARGLYAVIVSCKQLSSLKSIVLTTYVGTNVTVTESME
jgi:hypothetical protein